MADIMPASSKENLVSDFLPTHKRTTPAQSVYTIKEYDAMTVLAPRWWESIRKYGA